MKHLLDIKTLDKDTIAQIISNARMFKLGKRQSSVQGATVCMMFFENSTRTKMSFDLAAQKLGMNVLHFDSDVSSLAKGETIRDTMENLFAIGVNSIVVRTTEEDFIKRRLLELKVPLSFVNAGSGTSSHPTQALLDFLTMLEVLNSVKNKKICIVGDISHSRVASSNIELLTKFDARVHVVAPQYFMPKEKCSAVTYHSSLSDGLRDADVVMALRIQKERFKNIEEFSVNDYVKNYRLNSDLINKYCPNAMIMHPGPINREVEITSELVDSELGKYILEQAKNGTFVRMAVLEMLNMAEKK